MIILLILVFVAGLCTILAPCIWPILPVVFSSSIASKQKHRRPLGISLGILLSFSLFTLTASYIVRIFHFDPNIFRIAAVVIIVFLGFTMIFPVLAGKFETAISHVIGMIRFPGVNPSDGFFSGFITGVSLGFVWSPCAGPILATIATLAATQRVSFSVVLVTIAYVAGVSVPLFAIAYGGQKLVEKSHVLTKYTGRIQQTFGVIMIVSAIALYTNYDQTLQLFLINRFPILGTAVNGFENSSYVTKQLDILKGKRLTFITEPFGLFNANTPAPDFTGIDKWMNTVKPISINDLKDKVVLVDFWTYTCINCIRTLPYTTAWYEKYKDQGFVVIGVHTPEFQFEHDPANVQAAIHRFNIHYPVAQDNEYTTWNGYNNQYWPAEYLIDVNGTIRRTHFGEGEYDQMENAIRILLQESGKKVTAQTVFLSDQTPQGSMSPETYVGSARMQFYYPSGSLSNGTETFTLKENIPQNMFSYGGQWTIHNEYAVAGVHASLFYHFIASKVYVIFRPGENVNRTVKVFIDGKTIDPSVSGADVQNGIITVSSDRLYNVVDLHGRTEDHELRLEFQAPGIEVFTFTFG